jgi:hypothetical protein
MSNPNSVSPPSVLERRDFESLFEALRRQGYSLIGPTVRDGAIIYDELSTVDDLPIGWTDEQEGGTYRLKRRNDQAFFSAIPVRAEVCAACEILGLDPLYVANEGRFVAFVPESATADAFEILRGDPLGTAAAIIGQVTSDRPGLVTLRTSFGATRIIDMLSGEQLPRIC